MKKSASVLSLVAGFTLAVFLNLTAPAFADRILIPSNGPYTVNAVGSTTLKDVFQLDEQPVAFIAFDRDELNTSKPFSIDWYWQFDSEAVVSHNFQNFSSFPTDPLQLWDPIANWDLLKKPGEWHLLSQWVNPVNVASTKGGFGANIFDFKVLPKVTVTPEPVSTILFLTGGAPLAWRLLRKRQKS